MTKCPKCGAKNNPAYRFCGECSAEIKKLCPNCGSLMEVSRVFCGACGASLGVDHDLAGEEEDRRLITRWKGTLAALFLHAYAICLVLLFLNIVLEFELDEFINIMQLVGLMIVPMLINIVIALRFRGTIFSFQDGDFFIEQALREMFGFPGRVMDSGSPLTWLVLISTTMVSCVVALIAMTISAEQVSGVVGILLLTLLFVLWGVVELFFLSMLFWGTHLSTTSFLGKLFFPAILKGITGFLIGTFVAAAIIGLETAVLDVIFDSSVSFTPVELLAIGAIGGGSLIPALAWLSECFDRDLLTAKFRDELNAES